MFKFIIKIQQFLNYSDVSVLILYLELFCYHNNYCFDYMAHIFLDKSFSFLYELALIDK